MAVGETSSDGTAVETEPFSSEDLMTTVCRGLGISTETTFTSKNGRPMKIAGGGKIISELGVSRARTEPEGSLPESHGIRLRRLCRESLDPPMTAESGERGVDRSPLEPGELITRHQRGVWRYLRMLGCDTATADDLTQETFLRVLRRENFVQHSDAATSSYLRRTAYNLLVSRHRKQGRMQTVVESSVLDEIWDRWAGKDLTGDLAVDALRSCLDGLTDRAQTRPADAVCRRRQPRRNRRGPGDFRSRCTKLDATSEAAITTVC